MWRRPPGHAIPLPVWVSNILTRLYPSSILPSDGQLCFKQYARKSRQLHQLQGLEHSRVAEIQTSLPPRCFAHCEWTIGTGGTTALRPIQIEGQQWSLR